MDKVQFSWRSDSSNVFKNSWIELMEEEIQPIVRLLLEALIEITVEKIRIDACSNVNYFG